MADQPNQVLMTVRQVSERLQIAQSFVYKLIEAGELPVIKIGRSIRVVPNDLEAFIAKHRTHDSARKW